MGAAFGWASATLQDLPELNPDMLRNPPQASIIYDRSELELVKLSTDQNFRTTVPFVEFPKHLIEALIASEDHNYREHFGVDIFGVIRGIIYGGAMGGGSTITQQLVRNVFLTPDPTFDRKLKEMIMAIRLEQIYSKDEVLYFYLNQVFFGHWAKGAQSAARLYFGKDVKDLNLAESAMIIGLLPAPNEYSPYEDYPLAKRMQAQVLDLMVEYDKITEAEAKAAKDTEILLIGLETVQKENFKSSFWTDYVIQVFPRIMYNAGVYSSEDLAREQLYNGGLQIITTLDYAMQVQTEKCIEEVIQTNQVDAGNLRWTELREDGSHERQVAAVIVETSTGEIVTMVGGREYPEGESLAWNRAVDSLRQPGSCIKPLIDYAPALLRKVITLGTVFDDVPTSWGDWQPKNYDNYYFGLIGIREAFARSQNIPAIKTQSVLGIENGIDFMKRLGFTSLTDDDLFLPSAIGGLSQGVSVLEMTMAYATFMNEGVYTEPLCIKEVRDRNGRTIYRSEPKQRIVLDKQTNYLMLDIMKTAVTLPYGTSRVGNLGRPTAAKTGTTDDFYDLWFCGGTPDYTSAIWIGHDENTAMTDLYSSGIHPRIWREYMSAAHGELPARDWQEPANLVRMPICTVSGMSPSPICPSWKIVNELFLPGTAPISAVKCNVHVEADIDVTNNLLATPQTPSYLVARKVFIRRPIPLPYPLPYGGYPADAAEEIPTQYSPSTGQGTVTTPATPGGSGTPQLPGGTPINPGGFTDPPQITDPEQTAPPISGETTDPFPDITDGEDGQDPEESITVIITEDPPVSTDPEEEIIELIENEGG